ncbi:hypothetical protein GP486_003337 [Trichoglossum hirsutum]|uniref:Heterokaryon incompatibility domain-containing protein n=1 Tax=Trichoglossum hirsutum TaxID=265104 RepID=A0A9P8LD89_9PEZI|nr:hypothetical protein GP486_003337 [Trichoglossum hirsutum]
MDHLPYPNTPALDRHEILFLIEEGYSRWSNSVSEETPGARRGSVTRMYIDPIRQESDPGTIAKRLQADIYFGFLSGFIGPLFRHEEFVRQGSASEKVVSLVQLEPILNELGVIVESGIAGDGPSLLQVSLLRDFFLAVHLIEQQFGAEQLFEYEGHKDLMLLQDIKLSLFVLSWTFSALLFIDEYGPYKSDLLADRMLKSNWCPYWTYTHCERHSIPLLYYLSATSPVHDPAPSCTAFLCKCNHVDMSNYTTKHSPRCDGSNCYFQGPDPVKLGELIRKGKVPVLRLQPKTELASQKCTENETPRYAMNSTAISWRNFEIEVEEYTPDIDFTAVSHVWSGGLGNPTNNTLPTFQIDYIYRNIIISQHEDAGWHKWEEITTDRPIYLWIDTLCIPVDKRYEEFKGAAIDSMAFIYSASVNVMVLDPALQQISFNSNSDLSIAMRMLTCPWMLRCWTFQEGFLAREFWFVLEDRVISPRRWIARWTAYRNHRLEPQKTFAPSKDGVYPEDRSPSTLEMRLKFECLAFLKGIVGSLDGGFYMPTFTDYAVTSDHERMQSLWEILYNDFFSKKSLLTVRESTAFFVHVWNQLATRTTTQQQDLHKLLAIMFGLSSQEVSADGSVERSASQRMLSILSTRTSLPLSLVLRGFREGVELCEGNSWIPQFPVRQCDYFTGSPVLKTLDIEDGIMTWNAKESGWEWLPNDTNFAILLADTAGAAFTPSRSFCLFTQSQTPAEHQWTISVFLTAQEIEGSILEEPTIQLCFLVHQFFTSPYGEGSCFILLGEEESSPLRLIFVSPLYWIARKGEPQDEDIVVPCTTLREVSCILKCGRITFMMLKPRFLLVYQH